MGHRPSAQGPALIAERSARIRLLSNRAAARVAKVAADRDDVYVTEEGGLRGLVGHPDFVQIRRFTTCQIHQEGGWPVDDRLVSWELSSDGARTRRVADPLVAGLTLNLSSRHSGCCPPIGPDGCYLYVGTDDSGRGRRGSGPHPAW